jgi:hypothetical protein
MDCAICGGEDGQHGEFLGGPCPQLKRQNRIIEITREDVLRREQNEIQCLERLWELDAPD